MAAGFSLDMAVWSGRTASTPSSWRCAAPPARGGRRPTPAREPRAAVVAQLRATLPPGYAGPDHRPAPGDLPAARGDGGVELVAVSGYDAGDRLDGWYDALLATVSAGGPDVPAAARAVGAALAGLPDSGVPHDGPEVCAVLTRLADGDSAATTAGAWPAVLG